MLIVPVEGQAFPLALSDRFEAYYRARLRRVIGASIRSGALMADYQSWAESKGEATLGYRDMRVMMEAIGHRRRKSNAMSYCDVTLVDLAPDVPDTLGEQIASRFAAPSVVRTASEPSPLIGKVDAALSLLLDLRTALLAASDTRRPHEAAQRVLGLFDHG